MAFQNSQHPFGQGGLREAEPRTVGVPESGSIPLIELEARIFFSLYIAILDSSEQCLEWDLMLFWGGHLFSRDLLEMASTVASVHDRPKGVVVHAILRTGQA